MSGLLHLLVSGLALTGGVLLAGDADIVDRTPITCAVVSPDGRTIIAAQGSRLLVWDLGKGRLLRSLECGAPVSRLVLAPDSGTLASVSSASVTTAQGDGDQRSEEVRLWAMPGGRLKARLPGNPGGVFVLTFSPDGKMLATGGGDRKARLWDTETGHLVAVLPDHEALVRALAFSPDGKTLATAGSYATNLINAPAEAFQKPDKRALLWDVPTGEPAGVLVGSAEGFYANQLVFSPDGKTLALGGSNGFLLDDGQLWDIPARLGAPLAGAAAPRLKARLGQYKRSSSGLVFSPDGARLVSGGEDGTVQVWDAQGGKPTAVLPTEGSPVKAVAFSPDGRLLAAGNEKGHTWLWDVPSWTPTAASRWSELAHFPSGLAHPFSIEGGAIVLHSPIDGRVLRRLRVAP